jgi:hypothetical protein
MFSDSLHDVITLKSSGKPLPKDEVITSLIALFVILKHSGIDNSGLFLRNESLSTITVEFE